MPRLVAATYLATLIAGCSSSDGVHDAAPPDGEPGVAAVTIYPEQLTLWDDHRARVFATVTGVDGSQLTWSWDVQIPDVSLEIEGGAGVITMGTLSGRSELRAALAADTGVADVIHIFNSASSGCCMELVPQAATEVDRVHVRPGGVISIAAASAVRAIGAPRRPLLARIATEIVDGPPGASLATDGTLTAPATEGVVRILGNRGGSGRILEVLVSAGAPHTFAIVPSYARVANGASVSVSTTDPGGAKVQWELTTLAGLHGVSPTFEAPPTGSGLVLVRGYTEAGVEAFGLIEYP